MKPILRADYHQVRGGKMKGLVLVIALIYGQAVIAFTNPKYAPDCNEIDLPVISDYLNPLYDQTNEQEYLKLFQYNKNFSVSINPNKTKKTDTYLRNNITLKSIMTGENTPSEFNGIFYKSLIPGKRPLILIMPTIKGVTPIEHRFAKFLVKKGYHALIFIVPRDKEIHTKPATELNFAVKFFTTGTQLWIDHFSSKSYVDMNKIGVFATSDGANRTSIILGYEKRIKAAVLYVAGGNYPKMMTNSDQRIVRNYREYKMENQNLTKLDFFNLMQETLSYDPTYLAYKRNPKDLYMVLALEDTSVPTENQIELWQAFGMPKSKCLEMDHIKGALSSLLEHELIFSFLKERLKTAQ